MTAVKSLTILGATGSVGQNTLDLVRRNPAAYEVVALSANRRGSELAALAREFRPQFVALGDESARQELEAGLAGTGIAFGIGPEAVIEAATLSSDFVLAAIVGTAGLAPTMAAIERGATIGLANKECLVSAGDLLMARAGASGSKILPVDSEHNALYQVFDFERPEGVARLILTASGGPFLGCTPSELEGVTAAEAKAHPNWDMGAKISIDSATMMNKGLEVIEAYHLFPVDKEQIDVVVHPQSIVHSFVEYRDGSLLAQLGTPDMRIPIAYCLGWPERVPSGAERLPLTEMAALEFSAADPVLFPCLSLAYEALKEGGAMPLVLNAANEIAVEHFLGGACGFTDISRIIDHIMHRHNDTNLPHSLSSLLEMDLAVRRRTEDYIKQL